MDGETIEELVDIVVEHTVNGIIDTNLSEDTDTLKTEPHKIISQTKYMVGHDPDIFSIVLVS